jgi:hypothetical protein
VSWRGRWLRRNATLEETGLTSMTIRALSSPATGITVVALLLALLVTGGATAAPRPESTASGTGAAPTVRTVPKVDERVPAISELSNGCRYSTRGIPACGVFLGAAYGGNTDPAVWERAMGHRLGVHRTYYAADEVGVAVRTAQDDLAYHRIPWISFKVPYSWAAMAAGSGDAWARGLAERLSGLDGPVWIAFHHEPEGDGVIEDWTAMQERLAPIVRTAAPNVAFSVILTGWNQLYGPKRYSLASMWPDTKIDLVGFDVYNKYGVVKKGRTIMTHTQFDHHYFARFEQFAQAHDVAWGLAETGHTGLSADLDPFFVQHIYDGVSSHGGVAVAYFNSLVNSIADWRLEGAKGADFAATLSETPTL